jgi:hypothetical protein
MEVFLNGQERKRQGNGFAPHHQHNGSQNKPDHS